MQILLGLLGLAIIGFTVTDILSTTLTISGGGGPLTSRVSNWLWELMLRRHRSHTSHRSLMVAGYGIALTPFIVWIALIWFGWALIFNISDQAVVEAQSKAPADLWARIYFTGYTLFTLGMGDYQPQGPIWQILTAIASLSGFFLVTFAISFLIPVVSAATQERQLAAYISSLGKEPEDIVIQAWKGDGFGMLTQHLITLTPMLALHAQRYPAYPILRYFHSMQRSTAAAPSIAVLDEALTLLEYGVLCDYRPDPATLYPVRQAVSEFLETLSSTFIHPTQEAPPPPILDHLRMNGIPTLSDEAFQIAVEDLAKRRRLLLALVRNDGWSWHRDVMDQKPTKQFQSLNLPS